MKNNEVFQVPTTHDQWKIEFPQFRLLFLGCCFLLLVQPACETLIPFQLYFFCLLWFECYQPLLASHGSQDWSGCRRDGKIEELSFHLINEKFDGLLVALQRGSYLHSDYLIKTHHRTTDLQPNRPSTTTSCQQWLLWLFVCLLKLISSQSSRPK